MATADPLPDAASMRAASQWAAAAYAWSIGTGPEPSLAALAHLPSRAPLAAVRRHRLVGYLAPHADVLGLDHDTANRLRAIHLRMLQRSLRVRATTRAVSDVLAAAGVDHLVVKGAPLAVLQGIEPAARGAGDVDVWVAPTTVRDAVAALGDDGWVIHNTDPAPRLPSPAWRDRAYSWVTPEALMTKPDECALDLHWRLMRAEHALTLGFGEAWADGVDLPELGASVRTLDLTNALRHVAAHGTKDGWPTLRHVVDVTLLARRLDPTARVDLAAADPTVALALAVAARLDPALDPGAGRGSGRDDRNRRNRRPERLAAEAWEACLTQRLRPDHLTGPHGARMRRARLSWRVRSAPDLRAAWHPVAEWALPVRALASPEPLPRALAAEARRIAGRRVGPPGGRREG